MSAPVDVLAVMDAAIARETEGDFVFPAGRTMTKARAAVAELIEAATHYVKASRDWEDARLAKPSRAEFERTAIGYEESTVRLAAALARVGGAA